MISPQYLAGFFDGEGTFWLGTQPAKNPDNPKRYGYSVVLLSQSGEDGLALLEEIKKDYGGKIYHHLKVGQHKATKNAYKLYWGQRTGIDLINRILPYLIIKKDAAQAVLDYRARKDANDGV